MCTIVLYVLVTYMYVECGITHLLFKYVCPPINFHLTHMHLNMHTAYTTQDGPSDLPVFERVTGVSQSDLLHPQWTVILSLPGHSTPQQIEASVISLLEVCASVIRVYI